MSWSLSAQVTKDQDLDTRLEEATHEVRDMQTSLIAKDIEAAVDAAKALCARLDDRPLHITLTGHRADDKFASNYINVNITS